MPSHTRLSHATVASYLGLALAFLSMAGIGWGIASAWFALLERVRVLEVQQQYIHGDISTFLNGAGK